MRFTIIVFAVDFRFDDIRLRFSFLALVASGRGALWNIIRTPEARVDFDPDTRPLDGPAFLKVLRFDDVRDRTEGGRRPRIFGKRGDGEEYHKCYDNIE